MQRKINSVNKRLNNRSHSCCRPVLVRRCYRVLSTLSSVSSIRTRHHHFGPSVSPVLSRTSWFYFRMFLLDHLHCGPWHRPPSRRFGGFLVGHCLLQATSDTGCSNLPWLLQGAVDWVLSWPVAPVTEDSYPCRSSWMSKSYPLCGVQVTVSVVLTSLHLLRSWSWGGGRLQSSPCSQPSCRYSQLSLPSVTLVFGVRRESVGIIRYHPQVLPWIDFFLLFL